MIRDVEIDNAIRYALNHAPIREVQPSEDGDYEVEIYEHEAVKPFVLALLADLGVIK
ncbi:hypothetical protein ACTJJ7_16380 [Phyllobacterium sp. 22229]|uniref:hypothetical protein n=1 Tax=Phyllobacterium sp. 22229 TaxID=3453895 RepID=UPI003F856A64